MPSLPQVWLNFVADSCIRIVWWLDRIGCYNLLHALDILSIKTVFRPLCEVHRQIAYYDSRKWVNLKSNLPIANKYLHNQNPSLGHGKKEELCYDCLEKQWVPIMCSQFQLRWSGKSCPIHSGDGIVLPMRKDWWPPWMPTDLLFLVIILLTSIYFHIHSIFPFIRLWRICMLVSVWMTFTILFPAQGLKDLLEDNGLNQLPRSRPNMWVSYFVSFPKAH